MKKPSLRFRQVFESPTHFKVVKPLGNPLLIAKKGLSPNLMGRLRKFARDGEVPEPTEEDQKTRRLLSFEEPLSDQPAMLGQIEALPQAKSLSDIMAQPGFVSEDEEPVAGVAPAAPAAAPAGATKITPGRRLRDSAARGGHTGAPVGAGPAGAGRGPVGRGGPGGRGQGRGPRGAGRGTDTRERVKPEFDSIIIDIRRVTRVTSGGRRMNFSVAVVAGDRKGRVGVGLGKGADTAGAVEKATREAKKNLIKVPMSAQMTIPHATEAKYASARIKIFPARGRGVVAGSSARAVIELAGIKDVCAKFLSGSKNRLNNARVAIAALNKLSKIPRSALAPASK